jgi:hypothetical protein
MLAGFKFALAVYAHVCGEAGGGILVCVVQEAAEIANPVFEVVV